MQFLFTLSLKIFPPGSITYFSRLPGSSPLPSVKNKTLNLMHICSAVIGEIDDTIDQAVDLSSIRAEPIPPIRY